MTQPHETNDARRLELVAAAGRQWTDALTDLGGRNTLLYHKDQYPEDFFLDVSLLHYTFEKSSGSRR